MCVIFRIMHERYPTSDILHLRKFAWVLNPQASMLYYLVQGHRALCGFEKLLKASKVAPIPGIRFYRLRDPR
jgi:hypothetical protein